jgi:probable rRNA maturation factor
MAIEIYNRTRSEIDLKMAEKIAAKFMRDRKNEAKELSIVFVGDKEMRRLNRLYRKIDKTTDVLSFEGDGDLYGEIMISYQQIKRQAKAYHKSVKEELAFILVHGLLHLAGYDDDTEKDSLKMIKMGEEFIGKLGL